MRRIILLVIALVVIVGGWTAAWLYVSEGTGFWGPPMRVGTTQEVTAITLVPVSDRAR